MGILSAAGAEESSKVLVRGEFVERDGLARSATFVAQGIPIHPLAREEAQTLRLRRADGRPLAAYVEPESWDENGKIRWLRIGALLDVPARGTVAVELIHDRPAPAAGLAVRREGGTLMVQTPYYSFEAQAPGYIRLSSQGRELLSGMWSVDVVGDARAILWGAYYRSFEPQAVELAESTQNQATVVLRGFVGKNQRKAPDQPEPESRLDCELRFHLNRLTPEIRFDWRLTNLTGTKTWLQRYALRLPLASAAIGHMLGRHSLQIHMQQRVLAATADFIQELGEGAGIEVVTQEGQSYLALGGLNMPPDGGFYEGAVPKVHRLFYHGMSRTFAGALIPGGSAQAAHEAFHKMDLVLPAQYYSDIGVLPEQGDPVTFGEFKPAIFKAAEQLLKTQWRGTLFWGEWYREWDETRNIGVQEASNGHSPLAPLYHYWRTGDARFLYCARRSAEFVWDVQLFKGSDGAGPIFHTRRHLFDELDWIHPRYQRATGGLLASHVFLDGRARREIIDTIRSFHTRLFDEGGAPHDWDRLARRRTPGEAGVDTSNFMEALVWCYRETGDADFLRWALQMSRWTAARWKLAGKIKGDDWNWNLTNYVLRGLLAVYQATGDSLVRDLAQEICRATLDNPSPHIKQLKNGVGGGELHFVFYHAWLSTAVSRFSPDGPQLVAKLLEVVQREVARQREDGQFPIDHGFESGLKTRWTSYYDLKALVAYVPVLSARLAALQAQGAAHWSVQPVHHDPASRR